MAGAEGEPGGEIVVTEPRTLSSEQADALLGVHRSTVSERTRALHENGQLSLSDLLRHRDLSVKVRAQREMLEVIGLGDLADQIRDKVTLEPEAERQREASA